MAFPVLEWSTPEVGAKLKMENKLLKADFGDGYTQTCADGINNRRKVWDLTFPYMMQAEAENLFNFFDTVCGGGIQAFLYTVPGTTDELKWTCEVYDWTFKEAGYVTVTATIKQSFNLDG